MSGINTWTAFGVSNSHICIGGTTFGDVLSFKNSTFVIDEAYFRGCNVVAGVRGRLSGEMQCVYNIYVWGHTKTLLCVQSSIAVFCPCVLFVSNMMMITTLSLREKERGESALIFSF